MTPQYIVMLGPVGVGKGEQGKVLAERLKLPHVSTGVLFRKHLEGKTALGLLAHSYMTQSLLVPDGVTIDMAHMRLQEIDCEAGAVVDGYPRNPLQVEAFDKFVAGQKGTVRVVYINAPKNELIERLGNRWLCRMHGHVFSAKLHSKVIASGKCDIDDSELYQRDDDKAEKVAKRLETYELETAPLIEIFRTRGNLIEIDGLGSIEEVTARIAAKVS